VIGGKKQTCLAGVNVPSTSNKQIVFLIGRLSSVGITAIAAAAILNRLMSFNMIIVVMEKTSAKSYKDIATYLLIFLVG